MLSRTESFERPFPPMRCQTTAVAIPKVTQVPAGKQSATSQKRGPDKAATDCQSIPTRDRSDMAMQGSRPRVLSARG
jgi:hypothetical protein